MEYTDTQALAHADRPAYNRVVSSANVETVGSRSSDIELEAIRIVSAIRLHLLRLRVDS